MTKIYGTNWCADCTRAKYYLDKNNHKYEYINIDENKDATQEVLRINNGLMSIPVIVFDTGDILIEPTNEELHLILQKIKSN